MVLLLFLAHDFEVVFFMILFMMNLVSGHIIHSAIDNNLLTSTMELARTWDNEQGFEGVISISSKLNATLF